MRENNCSVEGILSMYCTNRDQQWYAASDDLWRLPAGETMHARMNIRAL
jgi:hypothetical protein